MFNNSGKKLLFLTLLAAASTSFAAQAQEAGIAPVNAAVLPINASEGSEGTTKDNLPSAGTGLVSPSKTVPVQPSTPEVADKTSESNVVAPEAQAKPKANDPVVAEIPQQIDHAALPAPASSEDFSFDLKMKNIGVENKGESKNKEDDDVINMNIPQSTYSNNPADNLGNSILSQMDSDLFSQMSEIEKSTTLLTLELRREKIRNEIEAQKAIRQKSYDDLERAKAEEKLRELEKKKQIEAQVIREQQVLVDKQQLLEVLKQRKLLNAYMNQMLTMQQDWLKEKESLYGQLAAVELEKKELIAAFKQKLDTVLEASARNIQAAEAAKANFERIIGNLKARNEQLKKRIAADAQIIKSAKNSLYLKSQSIEELKEKNNANASMLATNTTGTVDDTGDIIEDTVDTVTPTKLSSSFALLGISGKASALSVDVIDVDGQPISLRIGSMLPTGHVLTDVGTDYAKFSRDGREEFLYIGRTIDGFIPTIGLGQENK